MRTCFQRSAYTARSAAQRAALHSAQRYPAPSIAQRYTASLTLHSVPCSRQYSKPFAAKEGGGHRRLAKRERKAPQAKPPAGRGFGGRAPNYNSKQNLDEYFHVTRAQFQALYAQQARGRW